MEVKLGLIQMKVTPNKEANLNYAVNAIEVASRYGADIAVLPEMFCCPYSNRYFANNAEPAGGGIWQALSGAARRNAVYVVAGSFPEEGENAIYNTSFVFDRTGKQIAFHRKLHMFSIAQGNGKRFSEADSFQAGNKITVFNTEFGRIGLCICFDMRFPELVRAMALEGANIIIAPSAFSMVTGPSHWELIMRARAIDNQVFTVGVTPARDEGSEFVAYANSMICSPCGTVICNAGIEDTIAVQKINLDEIDGVRSVFSIKNSRRTDLY
jgi:omega-amidase